MKKIIEAQRDFFKSGTTRNISFRKKQLKKLRNLLKDNEDRLCEAIHADFSKSEFATVATELEIINKDIRIALASMNDWSKRQRVSTNLLNFPAKSYIVPEPLGVSLVIGAWNYPYQLSLAPAIAAIAAGCTVIVKPSEIPGRTSALMAELINNNFNPEFFTVVEGGVPETTELLQQKFDKIFFTGSTGVGKIVYKAAAEHLTPVTLELGGKSPAFVTGDCNLKMTVKRLIWGKFLNAGQTCIAPDYILVDEKIEDRFLELCVKEIEKRKYEIDNNNYVQIINDANLERLSSMIDPEKVFFGGKIDRVKRTISPTLLSNVSFEDTIMEDEIFGPLLPVISYTDLDKAIEQVKSLHRPLSCYVFSSNNKVKRDVMEQISFGGGAINEAVMQITNPNLPFGGVGSSGMGKYHGEAGFRTFSHYKGILSKPTWFELNIKYAPLSNSKLWWIRKVFKL
ncbi:MAG: aldehyde dehydrogenase family protein [Bacteroidia bacterium]|nr:aldehyde dehydrogenase family protein [Bacteroidia bacterium]MBT8274796.1 aldehyde dehydrogenase family protein [Bacteroidia bacterium]NNF31211.1 aldehyde dehydrogenase family protein [Flavobacteriaceae bacterium]NNK54641.1 aldehyde dehydrogenase family protein [Flavobacteriaceae bacterium]NNM09503.1 aldehyde dehydrogenase family protein [Flavobacteriaceae bacterium]